MTKPTNDPATNASKARVANLLLLAIGITILFLGVIQGFLMALIVAAILAAVAGRTCDGLTRSCGGRRGLAATLTVLLALLIVMVPALLLLGILLDQAVQIVESAEGWVETQLQQPGELRQAIEESPTLRKLLPYQDEIVQKAAQFAAKAASFLAQSVIGGAMGAAEFFLMLFVTLSALFTFLLHGRALLGWTFRSVPLTSDDKERLVTTFTSAARRKKTRRVRGGPQRHAGGAGRTDRRLRSARTAGRERTLIAPGFRIDAEPRLQPLDPVAKESMHCALVNPQAVDGP